MVSGGYHGADDFERRLGLAFVVREFRAILQRSLFMIFVSKGKVHLLVADGLKFTAYGSRETNKYNKASFVNHTLPGYVNDKVISIYHTCV